jgi:predicted DNA-binding transcriptional regulator AlpA
MQKLLNTVEAAPLIGVTPKTLCNWRVLGDGPKHIRVSARRVGYDPADIEAWKNSRRVGSTSDKIMA